MPVESFSTSSESFEDRIGLPEEFDAAVGKLAGNYVDLKRTIANAVHGVSGTWPASAHAATLCETRLTHLVDQLERAVRKAAVSAGRQGAASYDAVPDLLELAAHCRNLEPYYYAIMQIASTCNAGHAVGAEACEATARCAALIRGEDLPEVPLLVCEVLDVADCAAMFASDLEDLMLNLKHDLA